MFAKVMGGVVFAWNFLFNHQVKSGPQHSGRGYAALRIAGVGIYVGGELFAGNRKLHVSRLERDGDTVLIAAAAITVATLTVAAKEPEVFVRGSGRRHDGEHE